MTGKTKDAAAAAVAAGTKLVQKLMDKAPSGWAAGDGRKDPHRWRGVTVYLSPEEVGTERPAPLARLGGTVEVRTERAPGDRGTEIYARLTGDGTDHLDGQDPVEAVRRALRESKQLLEIGWIHDPDRNTTTEPTLTNAPLRKMTARSRGEGRL